MRVPRGLFSNKGNGSILVIDDAPALKDLIAGWLDQNEYRYVFVDDEEQGRKALARRHFDLVMYGHEFSFRGSA
jgi:DNA-binding response OmpR family regulator